MAVLEIELTFVLFDVCLSITNERADFWKEGQRSMEEEVVHPYHCFVFELSWR